MSRQVAWRLNLKEVSADPDALMPALQCNVALGLIEGSASGYTISVEQDFQEAYITDVSASLHLAGDGEFSPQTFVAYGRPAPGTFRQLIFRPTREAEVIELLFPLSREILREIEERRKGQKLKLQILLEIRGHLVRQREVLMVPENPPNLGSPNLLSWDALQKHAISREIQTEPLPVLTLRLMGDRGEHKPAVIELSRWLEILDAIGYASFRLYQIPSAKNAEASQADDHIEQAFRHHQRADWRNCLNEARSAIQALRDSLRAVINPVHNDPQKPAEEKAEKTVDTSVTLADAMIKNQGAWLSIGAAGSHPPKQGTQVEQADAELALNVALAMRQYVGRRALGLKP